MSPRHTGLGLWLLGLAVLGSVAASLHNPGTLDACYHFHVAQNLAAGRGMVEDLIWNYLDAAPAALRLPHPSHLYWMPMTAWLAWLGIVAFGAWLTPFAAAQVPFVLLASLIAPLCQRIALQLGSSPGQALLAGLVCLLAPAYLQSWVVPEPMTPFCLATAAAFWAAARAGTHPRWSWPLAGAAAGAAHLTRADGALVLLAVATAAVRPRGRAALHALTWLSLGYMSVMAPWFARNLSLIGAPLSSSVSRTAWLHTYGEIFSYHTELSAARWLSAGVGALLRERALAACAVLLLLLKLFQWVIPPLCWLGYRRLAAPARRTLYPFVVYATLLVGSMALIFPHPAQYGTLFRGASALLPWGMAVVPSGLELAARGYARLRRHAEAQVQAAFRVALLLVMALVCALFHAQHLHGFLPHTERLWNRHLDHYVEIGAWLRRREEQGPVMVVDPPGFTLATARASIMLPSDGARAVSAAAKRFGVRWLVLEDELGSTRTPERLARALPDFVPMHQFRDDRGAPVQLLMRRTELPPLGARPRPTRAATVQLATANR